MSYRRNNDGCSFWRDSEAVGFCRWLGVRAVRSGALQKTAVEDCGEPTCQPAAHRRTILRFEAGLGLRIRGGTVEMQQIDLFDSWFEPDPLDDAITFRRNDDPPVLTRLVISQAAHKN